MTDRAGNDGQSFLADWRRWRAHREELLTAPYGPLSPAGMGWLDETPRPVPGAPGRWSQQDGKVILALVASENPRHDGRELNPAGVAGTTTVALPVPDAGGYAVEDGDARVEIVRRGDRTLVRPRRPDNAAALGYTVTPTFDPDPDWVVAAEFHRYDEPRTVTVGAVWPGLTHRFTAVGDLVFSREGTRHTLQAFATGERSVVQIIFTDATSGRTTWRDNRQVTATVSEDGVRAGIDFNRAVNFPVAYTGHATCPLPPDGNRLAIEVTAGEKTPEHRTQQKN